MEVISLKAVYTATISDLLPEVIVVVQGSYSATRPKAPGAERLVLEAATWSLPLGSQHQHNGHVTIQRDAPDH